MGLLDFLSSLGPDELAAKRKAMMQAKLDAAGNAAQGLLAPTTGTFTEGLTRALPLTGEAWTANDAGNAAKAGNYGQAAAMGLLGLLPMGGMMAAGLKAGVKVPSRMGQSGAIAWHGSPHKFDKFSLDKIGTGEGAQAYGHGLYLAEHPQVAKEYQRNLTFSKRAEGQAAYLLQMYKTPEKALEVARANVKPYMTKEAQDFGSDVVKHLEGGDVNTGSLYKTDIPDEAVARFLDWDKPLSQQAPEVQAALGDLALKNQAHIGGTPIRQFIYDKTQQTGSLPSVVIGEIEKAGSLTAAIPALQRKFSGANDVAKGKLNELLNTLKQQEISMQTGVDYVRTGGDIVRGGYNPPEIAQMLQSKGIPGIRYLDGGSRSGGAGTSNFVAFDPELIRILERNGQATGNQPWKPGEWQGLLGGAK